MHFLIYFTIHIAPWQAWEGSISEAIESMSLPLDNLDKNQSGDSLPLGVIGVGDSIPVDVFQEHLQRTPGLL